MLERMRMPNGWLSLFLLFVMLVSTAVSISVVRWTTGLEFLSVTAILSLVAGVLLARSRFPTLIVHLFSLVYGSFTVGYLAGSMVELPTWPERVVELGERITTWLDKAVAGGTSRDSLIFVLLLMALFWLLGHLAAWYTFRRPSLWRALLPIGLALLVNYYVYTDPQVYTRSNASLTPFLIVFLIAALLYIVRTNVYLREVEWQKSKVNYSTEIRFDFVRSGALLALVALLVMFIAPGARAAPSLGALWGGIDDLRKSVRETATRLFSSLDTYGRGIANPFTGSLVLGGPRDLGDRVLFDVNASGGRYWRAYAYDRYTGDTWLSSDDTTVLRSAGQSLSDESWQMRREITQTVTVYVQNSTQLFAAPEPVRVPGLVTRVNVSFEQDMVTPASALYSQRTLRAGNVYQVVSSVSRADPDSLRGASTDYPDWLAQRYLQLPDTVTDRTRTLAQGITVVHETAFDKAQAIEQYLRDNLNYGLNVEAPPEDQDFVDFVLFDQRAGYCDYYASSFVVLARSVGIPARLAVGYAQDEYNTEAQAYRISSRNGHSWPEVFFPEYGWVQFEPTVIIDPISWPSPPPEPNASDAANSGSSNPYERPQDGNYLVPDDPVDISGAGLDQSDDSPLGVSMAVLVLVGLLVIASLGTALAYWVTEVRGMSQLSLVEQAYARMWRFAARLGVPTRANQTPYERAAVLTTLVPEGDSPIMGITSMYVVERFSRGSGNGDDSNAESQWSLLRPILWKTWLQNKFSRFQRQDQRRRWRDIHENS